MQVTMKKLVVALESLGYQCQYIDGSLIADNGAMQKLHFVESSDGEAIGTIPSPVMTALQDITEEQVAERFSAQMLTEMGYGNFSPSAAKPTGVDDITGQSLGIDVGDKTVTDEKPQEGPKKPQNATELPGDFTGDSDNNGPADVPDTGGDTEATTVGPHGASKTGKPGPNNQKPEKTQGIKVGHSLQQPDAPAADKGDYDGTAVGEIKNAAAGQKQQSKVASAGKAPAQLPTDQPAQSDANIPGPGKGKMTVTKATIESVLSGIDEVQTPDEVVAAEQAQNDQLASENAGKSIYVVSRQTPDDAWTMSGNFETTSPDTVANAKESSMEFSQSNPQGGSMVIFSEMGSDEVQQLLADGQDPAAIGSPEITNGQVESLNEDGVDEVLGAVAGAAGRGLAGAGKLAGKALGAAGKAAGKAVGRGAAALAKKGVQAAGQAAKKGAQAVGRGAASLAKKGATAVGSAVKRGAQAVGQAAKKGAQVVGQAAQELGADGGNVGRMVQRATDRFTGGSKPATAESALTYLRIGYVLAEDEEKKAIIEELCESASGLLTESDYGTILHPETFSPISIREETGKLAPIFVRMILEQDEDDEFPEPPVAGDEGTDVDIDVEPGAEGGEVDVEAGAEPGMDEMPPEDAAGEGGPGAPVDIDIGTEPSPQPVGDEQAGPGLEPGAPEPELAPDQSRWAAARQECPDCDDAAIEKLVQVGIVGDLYNELVKSVTASALQGQQASMEQEPIVASQKPSQDTTKLSEGSGTQIRTSDVQKRLSEAWEDDPMLFVDSLVDGLDEAPEKLERAASMILGITEEDYRQQDVQEARSILEGLGDQIRDLRNQLQDVRLSSVGKVQALVGSEFSRGAFAAEAQQMMDHLIKVEENLNAFLNSLGRRIEEFDQRYPGLVTTEEPDLGGEAPAPEAPEAAAAEEPAPPPPEGVTA